MIATVSNTDAVLALVIIAVVYAMGMVMQWDMNKTCEEQQRLDEVGPRALSVQQPSRVTAANGLASAEGNEAGTGANKVGADGSCPTGLTSDEPSRADTLRRDWQLTRTGPYDQDAA